MKVTRLHGRNVIDAEKDIILEVLREDVKYASLKNPASCAVARTCKRQGYSEARIHISRVYLKRNGGNVWDRYIVPSRLRTEIISFDRGGRFVPGSYALMAPKNSQKLRAEHKPRIQQKGKGKKIPHIAVKDIRTGPANGV
jgi:hypothetical protein